MKTMLLLLVALGLSGCLRSGPDAEKVATLAQSGTTMMAASGIGNVPSASWPSDIADLHPERVYIAVEGVYIVTSTSFVQERGVFVPRDPNFVAKPGEDPSYVHIREGVFAYLIRG